MTLLALLCLLSAIAVAVAVAGIGGAPAGVPAGALAAVATFQLLRGPIGRAAVRLLDR